MTGLVQKALTDIHGYWFEGIDDQTIIVKKKTPFVKWFRSTRQLDEEMREFFAHLLDSGQYTAAQGDNDRTALCRLLLSDQLCRNMFRGTPRAFAYDEAARDICRNLIATDRHRNFMLIERAFIYMPLTHSEDPDDQELSVSLSGELADLAVENYAHNAAYFQNNLMYARKFRDIIGRFGRFPHRNAVLSRVSTREEEEFLSRS